MTIADDAPPPLPAGTELAPGYEVLAHLSRGRALDVYDVWSEELQALCVAKALRPDRMRHAGARRRLRNEGRLLLGLGHPHIVRAYRLIERPHPIVVLEALTGATLAYLVDTRPRRMPLTELAYLGLQLCSAIGYLHRNGVLHLDLKPSNIVSEQGMAKVIDLSLARPPGPGPRGLGTRQYLAPEQARGGVFTEAADVWGIGGVLYRAAARRRPFEGLDDDGAYAQLTHRAPPIASYRRLPPTLGGAIDRCLEPDPARRPTLTELWDALEGFMPPEPGPS